ncbi:RHS repeat domain-containing protein [Solilutibacter silvestris]|uniref:RHS repeat-associated domain-containing protein n=1 Tax=Solilutibacter silvestris TaxID=1645665 RepID=A0A2K1Q001_9GAMM|nr:RHS repeat-associated core domain-containing protein [Lysobacter silvestris]PNS08368.1 RHS repeat-associated domain-containing protein [Lysobacter silvestris]
MKMMKELIRSLAYLALLMFVIPSVRAEVVEYIHTDALGSPVAITNEASQVIERTDYEPYGSMIGKANNDRSGFTGHMMDSQTGLTYMQQRYYDPTIGRFLSVDPVAANASTGASFNRYDYANNNPYRFKDPDGRKCSSADGKDSCTFDQFKDNKGNTITRQEALSGGSKLAKLLHVDRGSGILRAEAAMTAKYSAAKALAARGGEVTIKGNEKLGIPDQNVSGSAIVSRMETMQAITTDYSKPGNPNTVASVPAGQNGAPSNGPITFYRDGAGAPSSIGQTFGHEVLHTIYDGSGLSNRGWANPDFNPQHQVPFDEASDAIH